MYTRPASRCSDRANTVPSDEMTDSHPEYFGKDFGFLLSGQLNKVRPDTVFSFHLNHTKNY